MKTMLRFLTLAGLVVALASPLHARTFTYFNGRQVEAEFVRLAGNQVTLSIAGKPTVVMLGLFSAADQKFIRESAAGANPSAPAAGTTPAPFTQTYLVLYGSLADNQDMIAKYDLLIANRSSWKDLHGDSWKTLKKLNPKIQIYLYQLGQEINDNYDSKSIEDLNNLGRWNIRRPVPATNVNQDHPEFFLKDASGNRMTNSAYPHSWLMDIGLKAYQDYWLQVTIHDIVKQRWVANGIFMDNCMTLCEHKQNMPIKYPTQALWINAMHSFINATTAGLHAVGQKSCCNRCYSRDKEGYEAFIALDRSANPPDVVFDEGVFAVSWGNKGDVQFHPEADWKRSVDVLGAVHNSKITIQSHCKLEPGKSGTDNYGRPVAFSDILWYALCSYQLGKNELNHNSYFCFFRGVNYHLNATNMPWYDELDNSKLNLGRAAGPYKIKQVSEQNIYMREFERGYVYVNPTNNDVTSIRLKEPCKQLNHDNFHNDPAAIADVNTITLASHRGTILLKATAAHVQLPLRAGSGR